MSDDAMTIVLTVKDMPDGTVNITCNYKTADLLNFVKGRGRSIGANTSAAMYAMGMMTFALRRSRQMNRSNIIVLPPGIRGGEDQ